MALQQIQQRLKNGMTAAFMSMKCPKQATMKSENSVFLLILPLCFALVQPHVPLLFTAEQALFVKKQHQLWRPVQGFIFGFQRADQTSQLMPCLIKQSFDFDPIQSQIGRNFVWFCTAVNRKLALMMKVFGLHTGGSLHIAMPVLCLWQMQVECNCLAKSKKLFVNVALLKGQCGCVNGQSSVFVLPSWHAFSSQMRHCFCMCLAVQRALFAHLTRVWLLDEEICWWCKRSVCQKL